MLHTLKLDQCSMTFPVLKGVNFAMQYGLIQGYAYYLVYGLSMIAAGYVTDKYKLNRVYVVAIGSGLTGAALVIEVRYLNAYLLECRTPLSYR